MIKKIVAILIVVGIGFLAYKNRHELMNFIGASSRTINETEIKLLIKEDLTADSLAGYLISKNILDSKKKFLKEIEKQGMTSQRMDAGKYIVLSQTKIKDLVNDFKLADNGHGQGEVKVKIIFNRCRTIEDIGGNISKCIHADSASLVNYIKSKNALHRYNFSVQQMPALFLPDEYEMYYDTDAEEFVSYMADQFKSFWNAHRLEKLKAIGLSYPSQASTLASIVYSEQGKHEDEWPTIARLYLNRIAKGMKLQSDPTFKYCWGNQLDNVQRLRAKHRDIECEYNTYKILGLPPGPICIVPKKVIDAILEPDQNNYLFMCAKPDNTGKHDFTASDVQHMKNAKIYQQWLNNREKNK